MSNENKKHKVVILLDGNLNNILNLLPRRKKSETVNEALKNFFSDEKILDNFFKDETTKRFVKELLKIKNENKEKDEIKNEKIEIESVKTEEKNLEERIEKSVMEVEKNPNENKVHW